MDELVLENRRKYQARVNLFRESSYDVIWERNFIIEKSQPINGQVLELGTGKGYFTITLALKGYDLTTVDISAEEQKVARLNIRYLGLDSQVRFVIDNAEQVKLEDSSFDVAFAINLFHHLEHPFKVMDELMRIVTPTGKIVISDFSKKGFDLIGEIHNSEGRHHSSGKYGLRDIENYLLKKSIQVEKYKTDYQELMIIYKGSYGSK